MTEESRSERAVFVFPKARMDILMEDASPTAKRMAAETVWAYTRHLAIRALYMTGASEEDKERVDKLFEKGPLKKVHKLIEEAKAAELDSEHNNKKLFKSLSRAGRAFHPHNNACWSHGEQAGKAVEAICSAFAKSFELEDK